MPHTTRCDESDISYDDVPTSIGFMLGETPIFILNEKEDAFCELARRLLVTYRLTEFELCSGCYRCVMTGTDGSQLRFLVSEEDFYHNSRMIEDVLNTVDLHTVC